MNVNGPARKRRHDRSPRGEHAERNAGEVDTSDVAAGNGLQELLECHQHK